MNTNEQCLLKYLSEYSDCACEAASALVKFLFDHDRKIEFNNFNPVYNIIDEMEFSAEMNYNLCYEQKELD